MKQLLVLTLATAALLTGCRDLTLPPLPPPPPPGTIQGTLVYAVPGRSDFAPATAAHVHVLSTGLATTSNEQGHFVLSGITQSTGTLLLEFEADGVKRQRALRLQDIGAKVGRDITLGEVVLSRNAAIRGRISLSDQTGNTGLGGVTAFVPAGPWSALTADDGSYVVESLPEGALQVAFFRTGYAVNSLDVELAAGEEQTLRTVELTRAVDGPATVHGKIQKGDGTAADGVEVRMRHGGTEQTLPVSGAAGEFSKADLAAGVYSIAIERDGSLSIGVYNVLFVPGDNDLGTFELIDGTSTRVNLSGVDPMTQGGGGMPDGGPNTMMDGGTAGPVAIATGPDLAAAGSQVTLSGMSSTGDFPLTYHWMQTAGTSVNLSANDTELAHSPRFTAPAAGTVVEVQLVVEDRLGALSAPATVKVGIGVKPIARFTPDGGAVFAGGQTVSLSSSSYDDAGVVLTTHDWRLLAGTGGTLIADGGPTAFWQTPAVMFGDSDSIGGVTLQVSNGIGGKSSVVTQLYTVRGANPNNWSVDAGPTQSIVVGASPPQVQLTASIASSVISNPQYTVAWSCMPATSLVGGDTLTPRFVAPAIVGPTQTMSCTVNAAGQFPLNPAMISGTTSVLLRDGALPTVVSSNIEPTRMGRFGLLVKASEPLAAAVLAATCSPSIPYGLSAKVLFKTAIAGTTYSPIQEGASCSGFNADMTDFAQFPNVTSNTPFGAGTVTVSTLWNGPYVSSSAFDDPRPVLATLSQVPGEAQAAAGVVPGSVAGYELVAAQGTSLVRFSGLDVATRPTCEPSCALSSTSQNLNLPAGTVPGAHRAVFAGAELFVSMPSDGGVAGQVVRRSGAGAWSTFSGMTGAPDNWDTDLRTGRFEMGTGRVLVDTWNGALQQFTTTDVAATGLTEVPQVATAENLMAAATGPTRALLVRKRNASDLSWSTFTPSVAHTLVSSLRFEPMSDGVKLLAVESGAASALTLVRVDTGGQQVISASAVTGYDVVSWGGNVYVAYGLNGDIRFRTIAGSVWSGAGGGPVDFGGPPRTGYVAPYPVVLDANPACEAAYPAMAFVEDALVIAWQERCSPAVAWNVVARVVR
jgi:hypothetical protein